VGEPLSRRTTDRHADECDASARHQQLATPWHPAAPWPARSRAAEAWPRTVGPRLSGSPTPQQWLRHQVLLQRRYLTRGTRTSASFQPGVDAIRRRVTRGSTIDYRAPKQACVSSKQD